MGMADYHGRGCQMGVVDLLRERLPDGSSRLIKGEAVRWE